MKKNRIFGLASGLALLMAGACSNDVIDPGSQPGSENGIHPEDGVYMAVNFDLPSAKNTRSYTNGDNSSNNGTEVGHQDENVVKSALVVIARKSDNAFIAAGYAEDNAVYPVDAEELTYRSNAKISKTKLGQFYGDPNFDTFEKDETKGYPFVNIFVFANPTKPLYEYFLGDGNDIAGRPYGDTEWINKTGKYNATPVEDNEESRIWAPNHFLMANNSICTRRFPADLADWSNYNTEISAFNLTGMNNFGRPNEIDNLSNGGNIEVERAAARYDFRDGALDGGDGLTNPDCNGFAPQSYHMLLDGEGKPLVDVFLGKMSLVNMNRDFYYLRRVSNNGYNQESRSNGESNGLRLLGPELPWYSDASGSNPDGLRGNYVVDASADWKCDPTSYSAPQSGYADKFNYPFFTNNDDSTYPDQENGSGTGVLYANLNEHIIVDSKLGSDADDQSGSRWYTSLISNVLSNGKKDNWSANLGDKQYRTWRYLTEGTIPRVTSQKNCVSNGIVFKGLMKPALTEAQAADKDYFTRLLMKTLQVNPNHGNGYHSPILYVFMNHIYCSWEHIRRAAIYLSLTDLKRVDGNWTFSIDRTTKLYTAVFGNGGFGSVTFKIAEGSEEIKEADFLIDPDEEGADVFTLVDPRPEEESADSYYKAWKNAFPGDEHIEENEAAEYAVFKLFRDYAVKCDIALFQESEDQDLGGWGYYCYYYYWNRHNDNGQVGDMGPMEFAVVRNNVYKLAVTKISSPGHPGISANDPDRPNPDTPDEQEDVYITVSCKTLPWVVRENKVVF